MKKGTNSTDMENGDIKVYQTIDETDKKMLKVYRGEYNGHEYYSIRTFWYSEEEMEWKFGKGVTFSEDDVDELIEGLQKIKNEVDGEATEEEGEEEGNEDV